MCSQTYGQIMLLYRCFHLNEKEAVGKAKKLLQSYRSIVWATTRETLKFAQESHAKVQSCGYELKEALEYLSEFAPDTEKERFQERVCSLFRTSWLIELVDVAMRRVYEFPDYGSFFHELLSKTYLTATHYSETELLEELNVERSTYYARKKEAILLFALSLWGRAVPDMRQKCFEQEAAS